MTAVPGVGSLALPPPPPLGELSLPEPAEELPDDDEEPADDRPDEPSLSCWAKGSLLAKRLNEVSCPSAGATAGAEASEGLGAAELGVWLPLRLGAARVGVVPGVVVAPAS